jgi:transposase
MLEQQSRLDLPTEFGPPARPLAELPAGCPTKGSRPKYRRVVREQTVMVNLDLDELIPADHKARAIWEMLGALDLGKFAERVKSQQGQVGRSAWDPQLLCSVWLYGYSEGISSARELERIMSHEPGLMWLSGMSEIGHHTLSDFRVDRKAELDDLFSQLLTVLEEAKLVDLSRVMQDGSKIRARAAADSFRREQRAEERLARWKEWVEQDPRADTTRRREVARQRAKEAMEAKLQAALAEWEQIRKNMKSEADKQQVRVSLTEPEARMMKHRDGGIGPSYNLQVSTEASHGVIVGMELTQHGSDDHALEPAMDHLKETLGRDPEQVVVDGGYINRDSITKMEAREVDLIGPAKDPRERAEAAMKAAGIDPQFAPHFFIFDNENQTLQCPAGKPLHYVRKNTKRGNQYGIYQASGADCQQCEFQKQCCPNTPSKGRTVQRLEKEDEVVERFRQKMATERAQQIYKQRSQVAEFPFANMKDKYGLRKFRVFGRWKAAAEAKWVGLTNNVMIWIRLIWRRRLEPAGMAA